MPPVTAWFPNQANRSLRGLMARHEQALSLWLRESLPTRQGGPGASTWSHDHGIATDYHINESPMMDQPDFKHMENNLTFITPEDFGKVDDLVDWLIEKKKSGYKMVNSASRLDEMRHFMRGKVQEWNCRAGWNSLIVRTDGTLAPCME